MKKIVLNFAARLIVIVFQLISIKLLTSYLALDQLGIYYFLLAISYSANAILFVPIDYFQQAKLTRIIADCGGARALINLNGRIVGVYFVFSVVLTILCELTYPIYSIFVVQVSMLALGLYVVQALRNTVNNLGHGNHVSISYILESSLKVAVLYLLLGLFRADAGLQINAWLLSLLLTAIYLGFIAHKVGIFSGSNSIGFSNREIFVFSYPISIAAVCNWLQLQGYRLVLVPLGYAEIVGIFATLSSIGASAIGAASLIYGQHFTPKIYQSQGGFTASYLKGALVLTVVVAVGSIILGEFFVKLLTNAEFVAHWYLILFGVTTDAANMFVGALVIHLSLTGKTKEAMFSAFIGLIVMLVSFITLYTNDSITSNTLGVPLLISQWGVVLYMYWRFVQSRSKLQFNSGN